MLAQRTIQSVTKAVGVGLHSGQRVEITLKPATVGTGIVFRRIDLDKPVDIHLSADVVTDTRMASTISHDGAKVQTIEHLMSACAGLGIDNMYIEVNSEELPILDGSASSFVFLLQSAGICIQNSPKEFIKITQTVEVSYGSGDSLKWAKLEPFHGYKLTFEIDFSHPAVDVTSQKIEFDLSKNQYIRDISRARTFGFTKDVELMRKNGLALGGGLDNAIVLDDYRIINADGLRYEDEFAKHKILDAMGDLQIIGKPILGAYTAFKSGHALNNELIRELIKRKDSYEIVSFKNIKDAPIGYSQIPNSW